MKQGEIWGPRDREDMRALLRIEGREDDTVIAYPRFGGFLVKFPADEFAAKFEHYSKERIAEMSDRFEPGLVGLDHFEEGQDIPCWLNGENWNGWEKPFFERKHLDAALADGRITSNEYSVVEFNDKVGSYVEIMPTNEALPEDVDRDALIEAAIKAGGGDEVTLPNGSTAYVSIAPVREIQTPAGPVMAYAVGDGWTWSRAQQPAASAP